MDLCLQSTHYVGEVRFARDVVLGLGPWSLVVLKDEIAVLGPGLELQVLG